MRASRPAPTPNARRLARLRLRLTVFFTVASAVGLIALSIVALAVDSRLRADALATEMKHRLDFTYELVDYDAFGHVDLSFFKDDPVSSGTPQVYIFDRADPSSQSLARVSVPGRPDPVFSGPLDVIANQTIAADGPVSAMAEANDGTSATVLATPIYDADDQAKGAIVVVGDPRPGERDQAGLRNALFAMTLVLLALSAFFGYLLAGRSIRPAAEALEQQERFLADAAHELRTPVARLRAAAEGGLAAQDSETTNAALQSMSTLAEQAGEVVDNLLMLARMEAGAVSVQAERMRLDQLVGDVVAHHPDVRFDGSSSVVTADPALVRRAVDNLVTNAVRHAGGAEVTVIVVGSVVTVADRGPGIESEVLPRLFDRFVTNPATGGSGLGLSIVREIAEAHGGAITGANRSDGPGAVFVLSLPS